MFSYIRPNIKNNDLIVKCRPISLDEYTIICIIYPSGGHLGAHKHKHMGWLTSTFVDGDVPLEF